MRRRAESRSATSTEQDVPREIEHLPLPFSPAIHSGELVFAAAEASVDVQGAIVICSFEEEMPLDGQPAHRLEAAGCGFDVVVQSPRTTLANCLGPVEFEVGAIARVPGGAS